MMERLFQHNGWLKAISLVLAILLWAMVMQNNFADVSKSWEVPLEIIENPDYPTSESDAPRTVTVQAEGPALVVNRLSKEQFRVTADYREVREPNRATAVELKLTVPERQGVTFSVTPRTVKVTLVETATAVVPVTLEASSGRISQGNQDYRWTAKAATEQIEVEGRSDLLGQVRQARVILDENDLVPGSAEVTKRPLLLDSAGKSIDLTSPPVTVSLAWEQLAPGVSFRVTPVTKGALEAGLVVRSMEVEPATVTVRAARLDGTLPPLETIETEPIDLTGRTKSFITTVKLAPAPDTTADVAAVQVKVNIDEVPVEKSFGSIPLTVRGAGPDTSVSLSVSEVEIRLTGPYSVMTPLDAGAISAHVDLAGYRGGTQLLPVQVTYPAGITQVVVNPALVEVNAVSP